MQRYCSPRHRFATYTYYTETSCKKFRETRTMKMTAIELLYRFTDFSSATTFYPPIIGRSRYCRADPLPSSHYSIPSVDNSISAYSSTMTPSITLQCVTENLVRTAFLCHPPSHNLARDTYYNRLFAPIQRLTSFKSPLTPTQFSLTTAHHPIIILVSLLMSWSR